ncbi:MAG: signal peptidase I [Prevotellaceae bacterium]|jgi:signal peptidase I|nr:signal peptidase I [Prevotellaceae bacterium]
MGAIRKIFSNKWVKFGIVAFIYLLWVIWLRNYRWLLGLIVVYDIYISKKVKWAFWKKRYKKGEKHNTWLDWLDAAIFALIAATLIRLFFIEAYVIPTGSMEKTLLVGDYLFVSKVAYGPKMPNTPISFPLVHNTLPFTENTKSYVNWMENPYKRLAGFGNVKRGDIVVFNFPHGDTVALRFPDQDYYGLVRQYGIHMFQQEQMSLNVQNKISVDSSDSRELIYRYGREELAKRSELTARPVDRRDNYVKRCIGVPGDSVKIVHGDVYVNGQREEGIEQRQYRYIVRTNGKAINPVELERIGVRNEDMGGYDPSTFSYLMDLTDESLKQLQTFSNVTGITRQEDWDAAYSIYKIFPFDSRYLWTEDNFGPLWVPQKGAAVQLTLENLPLYQRIIDVYEENDLVVKEGTIYINGQPSTSYTFKMDYYFMMGDNRHNSLDSRYWGFVPEDHVVGKASFIWFSSDQSKSFPQNIRWSRIFKGIK